ncbi:MAG: GGDEF domain-containing protein [Lachnospiraceae bacterium]
MKILKKMGSKFLAFINSDVKEESESKELAVMLRVLSIIFGIYYTILSALVTALGYYNLSFILLFFLGLSLAIFICTYENKTLFSLYCFNIILAVASSFLTLKVGYSMNYHWMIFLTIPLTFYTTHTVIKHKFLYSFAAVLLIIIVTMSATIFPVIRPSAPAIRITLILLNTIIFASSITMIAYFYCIKYTDSENKILQYNRKLLRMASTDALTMLANRRSVNEHLKDLVFSSSKTGKPFSVAIGDVDFFKRVNDQYGHDTGDYVLSTLADLFTQVCGEDGLIGRWGGEEFLFVFENATAEQAYQKLEHLLHTIMEYDFHYKEYAFHISMTFGLEEYTGQFGIESVISKADTKLYQGKENGRQQVVF